MDGGLEALLLRGQQQQQSTGGSAAVLSASEAERLIEGLQAFSVEDVGSAKWQAQQDAIGQLNLQAHYNARTHSDEFVVDLLVSLDRVKVLIHDLLVIEAWRGLVLPHLQQHIAEEMDPMSSYMLLYQECAVANLMEVTLFHSHVCEAIPEDYLLELADWSYRKLAYLNSKEVLRFTEPKERSAKEMMGLKPLQELQERVAELDFASAMSSLSIVRYLTDQLPSAPMSLLSRLVSTNDTVMALAPLLDRPPWVRRRKGRLERWEMGGLHWTAVEAADRLKLGQFEIQVWLAVNNLVVDPKSRAKYQMDEYRQERLMGLKRHLNELLFDQLPVLKDLQRVLDELGLGVGGMDREMSKQAGLILEQVPEVRDALIKGRDWKAVARQQAKTHFAKGKGMDAARVQAISKMLDQMCDMQMPGEAPGAAPGTAADTTAAAAGAAEALPGPVSVECRRKVHDSGMWESFCEFELSVDGSRPPDPVEVAGPPASSTAKVPPAVHGLRYRLDVSGGVSALPLPSNGKIVFKVQLPGGSRVVAEALLQLPDAPLKESVAELPPVVWVTVGLLATDGAVLQLKLQRADKPQHRDKHLGVWFAYHASRGALTVRRGGAPAGDGGAPSDRPAGSAPGRSIPPSKITALPAPSGRKVTALPDKPCPREAGSQPLDSTAAAAAAPAAPVAAAPAVPSMLLETAAPPSAPNALVMDPEALVMDASDLNLPD